MRAVIAAAVGFTLTAGFLATPAQAGTSPEGRIVESLDRGLVAVPAQNGGTFLSWRLLGTEYGNNVAFNVYKGTKRLNRKPIDESTGFTDTTPGDGVYTVRAVVRNREQAPSGPALTPGDIPLLAAENYYVHHAWPGDLDGDGRYEIVVSRLSYALDKPGYLEAYTLDGTNLWRVDLGVNSYARAGGNAANDPPLAAISGYGEVAGYRNDDNVTVFDLDSDGRAEVFVKTANGVTFSDGAVIRSANQLDQFVSVVDGLTGVERERVPVADDFAADGPSGGQYGIAYLDGVHPSLITKQVVRIGAKRGDFRVLFAAWDFDGRDLTRRWKFVRGTDQGTSFHQLRIIDVDQDGKDDIADGNYVVNSDGTFRYVVEGSVHGDRFHIGDLDPSRPGLEGYAIQQTEGGIFTNFPWYYYDAGTGERLITGSHPDVPQDATLWDIPRGTTADIDPAHKGYEFWAATANPDLPGAGVWSVDGTQISKTTPSVNFRIWWDGDKGSELLDNTYVEKWNPKTKTSSKIFEPSGVVSSWRNAVPFYGDILGDWREEYFAETADHTTLRLFTTNIPTTVKLYTLAHNPGYRLGWTVRGYLQSTLTDFFLGYGSRPPARPKIRTVRESAWSVIAEDNFVSDSGKWSAELQSGGTVAARNGVLDIDVPNGATVWLKQEIEGPYEIEFTATPVSAGGPNDHVTDLNTFWNARDVRSPEDIFATARNGAFAQYDYLKTYYVGQGANLNTTTRFRKYVGEPGNRPLIYDYTTPLIEGGVPVRVRIRVNGEQIRYYSDDQLVFDYTDATPYDSGWFAFRTVASHFHIEDFTIWRPPTA
ncbi:hypothetical protein GCM10010112_55620 [Actinoplanes lobatus]|uniref:Rhamnogalacturonan endolyase n=1 Tax=Actinoplanes lobatus TaxID=113568 RepID=A0A7W7HES2_9ACTN|nr:DUF6250 domain-containing protein [Actinoplanes lobatus]MBB4749218.1 rhamnogalacturonan endolyase [Actinoplanes lobatus]GGN80276.1 hypothetical protein GCM10010112_55620 [Actinoplanes lobatus]GIE45222.1 hypothetical protein Alo02nite_81200 [Actinoplanes lobatus]